MWQKHRQRVGSLDELTEGRVVLEEVKESAKEGMVADRSYGSLRGDALVGVYVDECAWYMRAS